MDDAIQQRIAANESTFRDVNEAIGAGRWPGERGAEVAFRCECAKLGCNLLIELTVDEYERVRSHSRRFVVAPGHQIPEAETVVASGRGYVVVEKLGKAAQLADAEDPRKGESADGSGLRDEPAEKADPRDYSAEEADPRG